MKITKNEILEKYKNIIYGGYEELLYLNENTCVFCGYKAFGNIMPNCDTIKNIAKKARSIINNDNINIELTKKELNKLLDEFIMEVMQ